MAWRCGKRILLYVAPMAGMGSGPRHGWGVVHTSSVYHVVSPVPFHVHTGRPVTHSHRTAMPCNMVLAGQCASVLTVSLADLGSLKTFTGLGTQEISTWRSHQVKEDPQEQLSCFCLPFLSIRASCDSAGSLSRWPGLRCFISIGSYRSCWEQGQPGHRVLLQ